MLIGLEVVKANAGHLQMMVDGQVVVMRQCDWMINATQILKLSTLTLHQRRRRLNALREVRFLPAQGTYGPKNTWVDIHEGRALCVKVGLERKLRPLLELGLNPNTDYNFIGSENVDRLMFANEPEGPQSPFIEIVADDSRKSKSESLEDERSFREDDASSIDTDIASLHVLPATESSINDDDDSDDINANDDDDDDDDGDDEALSRQSTNDTEKKSDQHVEARISYYSYGDFEPRKSALIEVKLDLHAPSKTSSRYGRMTDASRSFIFAASDG